MGCQFPMAEDLGRYWSNILAGLDAITDVPSSHWRPADYWDEDPKAADRTYARRGGFLTPVDFPLLDFGMNPHALEATDTTQLLGLMVARAALEDAGYGAGRTFDRDRVSVILGVTGTLELVIPLGARLGHPIWRRALREAGVDGATAEDVVRRISGSYPAWQENSFPGLLGNVAAGRIANKLDLGGTNCVVDAACASSLGAVNLALLELAAGRCDVALSGGLDTFNDIFMYMCFSKTPALSPTGDARPFDASSDGTILGEGLGVLVLKRLADAERDGDRIYAVIRSMGTSSDGKGQAVYAPSAAGQAKALRQAYERAGITPASIELVEAHGTGTKVGDAIELEALEGVYRGARDVAGWCALGSVKSQLGHTKAAAGAAGLIKAAMALHRRVLPPTIKVKEPIGPLASGASPFYVNSEPRPWLVPPGGAPRRAAVSAFGFGGSNYHCVLEEHAPTPTGIDWCGDVQILAYTADDPTSLSAGLPKWTGEVAWSEVRAEGARSRAAFRPGRPLRVLMVASRGGTAPARLIEMASARLGDTPTSAGGPSREVFVGRGPAPGPLALVFPGQGSQYLGMFRELACRFPRMQAALSLWESLAGEGEPRLGDTIYPPAAFRDEVRRAQHEALRDTRAAQPAIGAVSAGLLRILRDFGLQAGFAAGHSFGELTALHAAGRIDERTLAQLSRRRGALMADCANGDEPGSMLAVLAPADDVAGLIRRHGLDLVIANRNAPRQCVLSGPRSEVDRAADLCEEARLTARRLAVSAAFHSRLVAGAEDAFRDELRAVELAAGSIPVFANATGSAYPDDPDEARELLAGQLAQPVEFVAQIEAMYQAGARTFLEVGPDGKLSGLVRSILEDADHAAIAIDRSRGEGPHGNLIDLAAALANLAAIGYPLALDRWDDAAGGKPSPAPAARKGPTVKVCGANPMPATPPPPPPTPMSAPRVQPKPIPAATAPEPIMPSAIPSHAPGTNGHAPPATRPAPTSRPLPSVSKGSHAPVAAATQAVGSALAGALQQAQESLIGLQRLAEQTADLHRKFLEGQVESQRSFQALFEHQQRLTLAAVGAAAPPAAAPATTLPSMPYPISVPVDPAPAYEPVSLVSAPASTNGHGANGKMSGLVERPPASPPRAEPSIPAVDVAAVLLEVVSEKTGYPAEMLELGMQLDADLGIDSIKRVEILSAIQDRLPGSPAVGPEHLGELRTLAQIADFLRQGVASTPAATAPEAAPSVDVAAVLLEVVSEKTGYPAEMLELGMQLDADLGIDSIKRVEILSAIQDRLPGSPAVGPEHLGELRTLAQIADFLASDSKRAKMPEPAPTAAALPEATLPEAARHGMASDAANVPDPVLEQLIPRSVPLDERTARETTPLDVQGEFWVTEDGSPLGAAVVDALCRRGLAARLIGPDTADLPAVVDRLAGLVVVARASGTDAAVLKGAFELLKRCGPGLRASAARGGAVLVTVSRLDGEMGFSLRQPMEDPGSGALAGLVKTAQAEWPEVACKAIDVGTGRPPLDLLADRLAEEVLRRGPIEVGLADGHTATVEMQPLPSSSRRAGEPGIRPGDVVVISGGARGITAEIAVELATALQPRIVLLGRTAEPERETEPAWLAAAHSEADIRRAIRSNAGASLSPQELADAARKVLAHREVTATLARIRAAGSEVEYHRVDVRDRGAVARVLAQVQATHGPVRGLIHGAGVLADRRIEDQTQAQFDAVFDTKVGGLMALTEAVDLAALRLLAVFSSSTARFGRLGQVAYSASNEWLNKWCHRASRDFQDCRVVSFNWGPWAGGMVDDSLRALFEKEGLGLIPLRAGARLFAEEIQSARRAWTEVVVLARPLAATGQPAPTRTGQNGKSNGHSLEHGHGQPAAHAAGNGRSNGEAKLDVVFERKIDVRSLPVIRSHVIDGHAVLPMALILEWLAEGALHRNPGLAVAGVDHLKLFKGIVLPDRGTAGLSIRVGKKQRHGELLAVPVEVHGSLEGGRPVIHARATVLLADAQPSGERRLAEPALRPLEIRRDEVYHKLLFHGPAMQAIENLEGGGDRAVAARVATAPVPAAWMERPFRQSWLTDPLAIDAAFQVVVLWTRQHLGANSLPTGIGSYRQYRRSFPAEGVRVLAIVREAGSHRAVADIEFLDDDGRLVARIDGYECVVDPSLNQAFRRNRLPQLEVASS